MLVISNLKNRKRQISVDLNQKNKTVFSEEASAIAREIENMIAEAAEKCEVLEDRLRILAVICAETIATVAEVVDLRTKLREMIQERKNHREIGNRHFAVQIGKAIQKEMKAIKRLEQRFRVERALESAAGPKQYLKYRASRRKHIIHGILDTQGNLKTDRTEIGEVFAEFYEALFRGESGSNTDEQKPFVQIPLVTTEEVEEELKAMKSGKAADCKGLVADVVKFAGNGVAKLLAKLFTDLLCPGAPTPSAWKETRLILLYKKGDVHLTGNYRPIALLSILYKLFSRVLCRRLRGILDVQQSVDQAGFREGFSCDDHLFTAEILIQKCAEWNLPLWLSAIDFEKAFDKVDHTYLWQSLRAQNVPENYIHVLGSIYGLQGGSVQTPVRSRWFDIRSGVRQGDPISPLLFNAVLEQVLRNCKTKWQQKRWGVQLGERPSDWLTNLRFADDLLLAASTLEQCRMMMDDLVKEAKKAGLTIHSGNTKVMHNSRGKGKRLKLLKTTIGDLIILRDGEAVQYLGKMVACRESTTAEITHRVSKAWACFWANKDLLCARHAPVTKRFQFFAKTVTPTMLYGCCSWTLREEHWSRIQTTYRRMCRQIWAGTKVHSSRASPEQWLDNFKTTTKLAEQVAGQSGVRPWMEIVLRTQWKWLGHVLRRSDDRWTVKALLWQPRGWRAQGRPEKRWTDTFANFSKIVFPETKGSEMDNLAELAHSRDGWRNLEEYFLCNLIKSRHSI